MKITYIFCALLLGLLIFYSCKALKDSSTKTVELVFLNAGKCFGKCKSYQLKIYDSGKGELNKIKNFDQLGQTSFDVSEDKMKELSAIFDKSDFSSFENEYLSGARDLQVFEITYNGKTVKFHKMKAPQPLKDILDFLQELI